jgi:hypothetical protein
MLGPQLAAGMGSIDRGHRDFRGLNGPAKGTDRPAKSRDWPFPFAATLPPAGWPAIQQD